MFKFLYYTCRLSLLINPGSCSMLMQGAMRAKRFIFVNKLHSAGSVGETKFFKESGLTPGTLSNWPHAMSNYGL